MLNQVVAWLASSCVGPCPPDCSSKYHAQPRLRYTNPCALSFRRPPDRIINAFTEAVKTGHFPFITPAGDRGREAAVQFKTSIVVQLINIVQIAP